jgi:hypothetical protein
MDYAEILKASTALKLAACIRRACDGPIKASAPNREHALNDYYWHTREACGEKARKLGIFFPDIISEFKHKTCYMGPNSIKKLSEDFWEEVMHPEILVQEVMET